MVKLSGFAAAMTHREGLQPLLLGGLEGNHVADDEAALVMDEMCVNVGRDVRAHAQQLQEDMAMRLGVTLTEQWEFERRGKNRRM